MLRLPPCQLSTKDVIVTGALGLLLGAGIVWLFQELNLGMARLYILLVALLAIMGLILWELARIERRRTQSKKEDSHDA